MKKKKLFIRMSAKVILKLLKMFTVFCLLSTPLAANNQLKVYSGDVNYQGFVWYQYNGKVFDHKKPTLIFIHGWPDKRDPGYFKTFKYAEDFLKRGYNVGFYRWQIPVIQFGCKGAGSMRAKVGGFLNAIWEPGGCGDKFRNDLKNIFQYGSLKNYKKAITLMSHSTGAQLIIFGLNDDYLRNNLKLRIVFTDPFLPWQYRDKTAYNTNTTIDVIKKTGKIHPILWICSSFVGRAAYRFHWAKDNSIQKYITRIYLHPRERISEMIGTLSYWRFLKLRRVINKMAKSEDGWYKRELRSTISRLEYRKKKITKRLQGRIENKLEKVDNIIISLQKRRRKAEASKNKKLNSRIGNLQKKISRLERIRAKARFKRRKKKLKKRINRLKDKKRKLEKKKRSSNGVMKAIDKRIAFQKGRKSKITKRINNLLNFRIDFINTRISNLKTKLSKAGNGLERNILQ
ncbi:MAG: hypothetical protein KAS64_11040, partial [Spirochaetes bacterium]|nr:hypothetical protein [Spirochaetota bacterium]